MVARRQQASAHHSVDAQDRKLARHSLGRDREPPAGVVQI